MSTMTNRLLISVLLLVSSASGGFAQRRETVFEPVRFEDGTAVTGDAEAEELFTRDCFRADTTFTQDGDSLIVLRHASAYVRMHLNGLPGDADIDRILLVPMEGEVSELPVSLAPSGELVLWTAKEPGILPATAAVAQAKNGRIWSARLPSIDLQPGIAYSWTGTCLTPDAPDAGLTATSLPQTLLDIDSGEYSGITRIQGNRYAVVSDNLKGGGILHFAVPIDPEGNVGPVSMRLAAGTADASGKARDCEGIAYVPSTGTLYISTEKQEIREYDLAGRETGKALRIPDDLGAEHIQPNRGFEALSYNDSTGVFWTTTESPLKQDTFLPRLHRLQSFRLDGTPAERFLYQEDVPVQTALNTTAYVHGIPAIAALDDGRLLVLEREVYVPKGGFWDKLSNSFTKDRKSVV